MHQGTAKFARQTRAAEFFAEVSVEVEQAPQTSISAHTQGEGFRSQGDIESAPAVGYDDWKAGAILGAQFALETAKLAAVVCVTRISGISSDTNPSIVAAAAALAVWAALKVQPQPHARERVERIALESWESSPTALPVLSGFSRA